MTDAANREPSDVNGSRVTSDVDGSRTTSYVDGSRVTSYVNGSRTKSYLDGSRVTSYVDVIVLALPNRAAQLTRPPTVVIKNLHSVLHNLSGDPTTTGRR